MREIELPLDPNPSPPELVETVEQFIGRRIREGRVIMPAPIEETSDKDFWNQDLAIYGMVMNITDMTIPKMRELRTMVEDFCMENNVRIGECKTYNGVSHMF